MSDDQLSATLAPFRERQAKATAREGDTAVWLGAAMISATEDVPRLLAAVDAVLKLADNAKPGLSALCTCYDCERFGDGTPGYEDYTPHPGRVLSWKLDPADLRAAILAALTGKEKTGG